MEHKNNEPLTKTTTVDKVSIPDIISAITPLFLAICGTVIGVFVLTRPDSNDADAATLMLGIAGTLLAGAAGLARTGRKKTIKKHYSKLSVIGIIRKRKSDRSLRIMVFCAIAFIAYVFSSIYFMIELSYFWICLLLAFASLINLESWIFNYRINQGWYGDNELEAREILKFVFKESDDIDFTDGGKSKPILKPEDIQIIGQEIGIRIPGFAQSKLSSYFNKS